MRLAKQMAMELRCSVRLVAQEGRFDLLARVPPEQASPSVPSLAPALSPTPLPAKSKPSKPKPSHLPEPGAVSRARRPQVDDRLKAIYQQLAHAFRQMPGGELQAWSADVLRCFAYVLSRRFSNAGNLLLDAFGVIGRETIGLADAILNGRAGAHAKGRLDAGADTAERLAKSTAATCKRWSTALLADPADAGPQLLMAALAFYLAGGGLDGDGGIPDQDITVLGIGGHRSLLTHSVLPGAVIETALFATVSFMLVGERYLPRHRDPVFAILIERSRRLAGAVSAGTSAGLAYHLAVDAVLQPGAYKDLPIELPIEGHQAIAGVNSAAEAVDLQQREPRRGLSAADQSAVAKALASNNSKISAEPLRTRDKIVGAAVSLIGLFLFS